MGAFLRRRRGRLAPEAVGFAVVGRRRVPGLRREELAQLAGVSADYYIRVEQDRVRPSDDVLRALARALDLDATERAHLLRLARGDDASAAGPPDAVRPGVRALLDRLEPGVAFVLSPRMDVLAWTRTADHLYGLSGADIERNLARRAFLAREQYAMCSELAAETVGYLRRQAGLLPGDAELQRLIGELAMSSPTFAELWSRGDVNDPVAGRKTIWHPDVGRFEVDYESLGLTLDGGVLVVYAAPAGSPGDQALTLLAALAAG